MSLIRKYIVLALLALGSWLMANAQETEEQQYTAQFHAEMRTQLNKLTYELDQLSDDTQKQMVISEKDLRSAYSVRAMESNAQRLNQRMQALNVKWDAFNASYLGFISENDTLMEIMTQAQLLKQSLTDTIAAQQSRCTAIRDFMEAESLITAQDSIYQRVYKQAYALSFVQKLGPKLERLKAREQLHFAEIQASYDKAKAAADLVPQLQPRATILNDRYYSIKTKSEQIQQMKYMPLIQRFKDYLMGLASVAVILLLFNNLTTKWKAAKEKKEAIKQQAELLKKQQNEYPTI